MTVTQVPCVTGATTDQVESVTTAPTALRYDAASGQFVYTWKSPKTRGTCHTVTATTPDGSDISATFRLT
jgi:hypothetical protein